MPADEPTQFTQFIELIKQDERNPANIALSLDLSALTSAANESAATGQPVQLDR